MSPASDASSVGCAERAAVVFWWVVTESGFLVTKSSVEAVRTALVGDRRQHQGVAVKPVAKVLVTLTGFLVVWLAKIAVARFGGLC